MSAGTWMPLYWGDYVRATGHLTLSEHGAYMFLINTAWQNGGSLPLDSERLRLIAKMDKKEWKTSREVLLSFFYEKDGEIRHKRVDEELAKAEANIEQKSAAGKASAAARAASKAAEKAGKTHHEANREEQRSFNGRSTGVATETPTEPQRQANPSPSPSPISTNVDIITPIPPKPEAAQSGRRSVDVQADFERFWSLYPRKVGKGAARKAWDAASRKALPEQIQAAVRSQRFDLREKFIPHPATWLNQERWADEVRTGDPVLRAAGLTDDGELFQPEPTPDWLKRPGATN